MKGAPFSPSWATAPAAAAAADLLHNFPAQAAAAAETERLASAAARRARAGIQNRGDRRTGFAGGEAESSPTKAEKWRDPATGRAARRGAGR